MSKKPLVFCIIVTFNGERFIRQCLHSLFSGTYPVQVIVVDNASTDRTCEIVRNFPHVICLLQQRNLGFGRGNNIGIKRAIEEKADYFFLLNQDAYVESSAIQNLVYCGESYTDYGIFSPIHFQKKGGLFNEAIIHWKGDILRFYSDLYKGKISEIYKFQFINAASWLIRKSCLHIVGGFDPIFFLYGEDDDYCRRASLHGVKIGLVPAAIIYHETYNRPANVKVNEALAEPLLILKDPRNTFMRQSAVVLIKFIVNMINFSCRGQLSNAVIQFRALFHILLLSSKILKHRNVCLKPGPHWL